MPYVKQNDRKRIDPFVEELFEKLTTKGDMNYAMTRLLHLYIQREGKRYKNLNDAIGVVECVKQEFYRKIVVPYEEEKIAENGDIKC